MNDPTALRDAVHVAAANVAQNRTTDAKIDRLQVRVPHGAGPQVITRAAERALRAALDRGRE